MNFLQIVFCMRGCVKWENKDVRDGARRKNETPSLRTCRYENGYLLKVRYGV